MSRARIHWLRVGSVALLALTTTTALIGTAFWLYFVEVRNLREVHFVDTVTPSGWRHIRTAFGDRAILDADTALRANDLNAALRLYRIGVAKSPRNASGRIALAKLYVSLRRPDLARDLLARGLPALAENTDYLRFSLGFLLEFQFDTELRAVADQLLAHPSIAVRHQAALHAAAVAFHRGNFDGAENVLVTHQLTDSPDGALLLARSDFERGFPELALARLTPALNDPAAQTAALTLAAQIHERLGRAPDIARNATLRLADDPLSPTPRLALLQHLRAQHRTADLAREIDSYLQLFSHDESALLALGDFAAHAGQPALARRIQQLFAQNKWSPDAPAFLYAEACIAATRYADGLAELDRYLRDQPSWASRYAPVFDGLRAIALLGLHRDDDARLQLEHLLAQPNLRAENLSAVAARLLAFDRPQSARAVLTRATEIDPRNQAALTDLVRLEAELGQFDTLPTHLRRLLAMRRPSREVLTLVYRRLGSDLNLLHPEQPALLAALRLHLGREVALAASEP
ncbi:MAG: hypothetical protein HYV96_10840 [Opitutae bacterium]|nr:hypothetical protein [Opitutae bacterium]